MENTKQDKREDEQPVLRELTKRGSILAAVGEAATGFMLGDDLDSGISDLLRRLRCVTDVCRVYVFERHCDTDGIPVISQRYEQTRDGIAPEMENQELQEIRIDDPCFVRIGRLLICGEVVQGDVESFMDAERAVLEPQGIKSLLLVPIFVHAQWWGFIGFDACHVRREWSGAEVGALRIAAGLLGASMARLEVENELRHSEERLQVLLENMPAVAIQGYHPDGTVHYWNRASETMYGYNSSEAIGRNLVDLIIPPDLRPFVREAIRTGAETGVMPAPAEFILMRRDGTSVPVFSSHAVIGLPGRDPEMYCIDIDLSSLKDAESELRRREREFVAMAENSPDIIMRQDRDFRHLYVNPAVMNVVNIPPEEWIGKTHAELGFSEKLCRHWETKIREVFDTAEPCHDEFELDTPEGTAIIDWRLIPETDEEGKVVTVLSVSRDVTYQHRMSRKLKDNARELAESREQLRRLRTHAEHIKEDEQRRIARRIHDEFGQRLTSLTMDLTWLRDSICGPHTPAYHRVNGDLEVIGSLLALARDISMELRPSVLDHFGLPAALEWSAEKFEESTGIPVDVDIDEELRLPKETESGMYRIVQELLTNIARHAEAGRVRLSYQKENGAAQIVISDDGRGMPEDAAESQESMGLLAIQETALSIVGTLDIQSRLGSGTTVTVSVAPSGEEDVC